MPEWVTHLHQTPTRAYAIATNTPTRPEDMPSLTEYNLSEAADRALRMGVSLETTVNNTTSEALCQGQTANPEITMKNFVTFTVRELFILTQCWDFYPTIIHKDKEKSLRNMIKRQDGRYELRIKLSVNRDYVMEETDTLEMDVGPSIINRFRPSVFFKTFANTQKFRLNDWVLGHYGVFISETEVYDSVRGRRNVDDLPSGVMFFDTEFDAARQQAIVDVKQRFIADPAANMTCGFELETQATEGITRRDMSREARGIVVDVSMKANGPGLCPRWIRRDLSPNYSSPVLREIASKNDRSWRRWLKEKEIKSYADLMKDGHITQQGIDQIRGWMIDNFDSDNLDYDTVRELLAEKWKLSEEVDLVSDESVSGFELRTHGAKTVPEFVSALKEAFSINHTINTRCSFHIHLKVNGLKHTFNRAQRQHMIRYLFENVSRLPETVRTRWADNNANYFFLPDRGNDKMNFINFHSRYDTIEFRCFGNVQTVEEGSKCLELAVEALQDYYENESPLFVDDDQWGVVARSTMETGDADQLDKFAKAHLAHIEIARESQVIMDKILPELQKIQSNRSFNFTVGA